MMASSIELVLRRLAELLVLVATVAAVNKQPV